MVFGIFATIPLEDSQGAAAELTWLRAATALPSSCIVVLINSRLPLLFRYLARALRDMSASIDPRGTYSGAPSAVTDMVLVFDEDDDDDDDDDAAAAAVA